MTADSNDTADTADFTDDTNEGSADTVTRVGCVGIPAGVFRDRYVKSVDFLELDGAFFQVPKTAAMRKRAETTPAGFRHGIVAWQIISHLPDRASHSYPRLAKPLPDSASGQTGAYADTPTIRDAVQRVARAAEALQAETVLFRTAPDFAPSSTNRDVLRHFFGEVAPAEAFGTCRRVWEPQGLWELETAAALAEELGLVMACDPLTRDPIGVDPSFYAELPNDAAYFRMTRLGAGGNISDFEIDELLALAEVYQRCWFVIGGPDGFRDAVRLRKAVHKTLIS